LQTVSLNQLLNDYHKFCLNSELIKWVILLLIWLDRNVECLLCLNMLGTIKNIKHYFVVFVSVGIMLLKQAHH